MFQAIRKQITPATVLAFVALVFAVTGGAFAATGGGSGGGSSAKAGASVTPTATAAKAKAKPKSKAGARGPAGPKGAMGATGATGPAGAQGAQGVAGAAGPKGETGSTGLQGPEGKEGKEGKTGPEGKSGFTENLPEGKTLKGDWSVFAHVSSGGAAGSEWGSVSFGIPVENEAGESPTPVYVREGAPTPEHCLGSVLDPGAEPGYLCVFASEESNSDASINKTLMVQINAGQSTKLVKDLTGN